MAEVKVEDSGLQALIKRWWWLIVLVLLVLGFLCVAVGPGQFLITPAPEPTDGVTETPPNDVPTETSNPTEEGGGGEPTESPTDKPTDEPTPTDEATEEPTATVEVTEQYFCGANPNDGVCCIGVENTDLDSACVCDGDGACEVTEGFNCGDCQGATCGTPCTKNSDCKNPYLTCNGGQCGGDTCPAPPPNNPKCDIDATCSNVSPGYPDCIIYCPGGGNRIDVGCVEYLAVAQSCPGF